MKRTLYILFLITLFSSTSHIHTINITSGHTRSYMQNALVATAVVASAGAFAYYYFLPATTQTAIAIGTTVVHETVRIGENAATKTVPYGAGGFLIHHVMNVCGIHTQQATSRIVAAMATLFLLKIQLSQAISL